MATVTYTTSNAWSDWNTSSNYYYSDSSADETWATWTTNITPVTTGGTATYVSGDEVWQIWVDSCEVQMDATGEGVTYVQTGRVYSRQVIERTHAQKMQEKINAAWLQVEAEERKREKEEAELTAQKLLMDIISEEQMEEYQQTGNLVVKGRKYDYVLRKNGAVYRVDKGKVHSLCIHLKDRNVYPDSDNVIALKLAIDSNERRFNKEANASDVYDTREAEIVDIVKRVAA